MLLHAGPAGLAHEDVFQVGADPAGLLDIDAVFDQGLDQGGRLAAARGAAPADDRAFFAALARTGATYPLMQPPNVDAALTGRAVAALNDAFAAGDAQVQAFTLITLAADDDARSPFRTLFDLAVRSDDDVVRVAHLAAHVSDPLDPALVSAVRDGGPRVRRFAQALTDALKQSPLPQGDR